MHVPGRATRSFARASSTTGSTSSSAARSACSRAAARPACSADGDCFGEASYVRGARRTATIKATGPGDARARELDVARAIVVGVPAALQQGVPALADRAAARHRADRDLSAPAALRSRSSSDGSNGARLGRCRLLQQDLDFLLRFLQRGLTLPRELHAVLEFLERLLERQVAAFEARDERLELLERLLEPA